MTLAATLPGAGAAAPATPPARAASAAAASRPAAWAGSYALAGVRETASYIVLHPDGRFEYALAYGGAEASVGGTWQAAGAQLQLVADQPEAAFRWGQALPQPYGAYADPARPVALVVRVEEPARGLVWGGVDVRAEFTNGQQRSGSTARNGMLGFDERAEPAWRGQRVRRIGVRYQKMDWTWFDIDAATRTAIVHFTPGPFAPPPFTTLHLRVEPGTRAPGALVAQCDEPAGQCPAKGWRYMRQ